MPHEIDAVELVAKALAGGDRGLEVGFAEHVGVDLGDGDDGADAGHGVCAAFEHKAIAQWSRLQIHRGERVRIGHLVCSQRRLRHPRR